MIFDEYHGLFTLLLGW